MVHHLEPECYKLPSPSIGSPSMASFSKLPTHHRDDTIAGSYGGKATPEEVQASGLVAIILIQKCHLQSRPISIALVTSLDKSSPSMQKV